jgi:hypothetical protein
MELDNMGMGLLLVCILIVVTIITVYILDKRANVNVVNILKGQQTLIQFLVKDYQERTLLLAHERTNDSVQQTPAIHDFRSDLLKEVGSMLESEVKAGSLLNNWPTIISNFNNGTFPQKEVTQEKPAENEPAKKKGFPAKAATGLKAYQDRLKAKKEVKLSVAGGNNA